MEDEEGLRAWAGYALDVTRSVCYRGVNPHRASSASLRIRSSTFASKTKETQLWPEA